MWHASAMPVTIWVAERELHVVAATRLANIPPRRAEGVGAHRKETAKCGIDATMTGVGFVLLIAAIAIPVYAYAGYPMILVVLGRAWRNRPAPVEPDAWPMVTLTLPVYNEERVVAGTLDAILAADYPREKLHVLVVSDASTDRTDDIVREYAARGVELLRLPQRSGKTVAENAARGHLRGTVVVNTDASVRIDQHALKPLVAALRDPSVGIASGRDVSVARAGDDSNVGESGYVGYEMWVRGLETRVGGIVGASGCFYASRAQLHREIVPAALSRDFAAPLIAREFGYRAVSVNEALCYVPRTPSLHREFHRKVRTMARGLETLYYKRHMLNPIRYGRFAWMLWSHKLVRWLVPPAWVAGGVGTIFLAVGDARWWWAVGAGALAIAMALVGWSWPEGRKMPRLIAMPTYLIWGLIAGLGAWAKALRRELNPIWEPTRRDTSASA